ncbi:MAG: helix-turn-helix domain-containing protein [Gammaproteobacteria bacterium]|nr:helix-turn-helix domain-containing protein [Gammaproteobacteria bacterium]
MEQAAHSADNEPLDDATPARLQALGEQLLASPALGRTRSYRELFAYLLRHSVAGHTPKELEIAIDVFGKRGNFDVAKDAFVRVYIHKLRQKLHAFYQANPAFSDYRLTIPKGQYRIVIESTETNVIDSGGEDDEALVDESAGSNAASAWPQRALLTLTLLLALVAIAGWWRPTAQPTLQDIAAKDPIWQPLLAHDMPLLVVLGDYYIFGETDGNGGIRRLVREFSINSPADFDSHLLANPEQAANYRNLDLNYLPVGVAYALRDVMPVLAAAGRRAELMPASELRVADIRARDILYLGYISALGPLNEFTFASSGLTTGESFDVIIDIDSGARFVSEAAEGVDRQSSYRDYGLLSVFPGPAGNRIMVVAGTRDPGLMEVSELLSLPEGLARIRQALGEAGVANDGGYETLFEVTGSGKVNLDAMLVHTGPLNARQIWGGEPLATP